RLCPLAVRHPPRRSSLRQWCAALPSHADGRRGPQPPPAVVRRHPQTALLRRLRPAPARRPGGHRRAGRNRGRQRPCDTSPLAPFPLAVRCTIPRRTILVVRCPLFVLTCRPTSNGQRITANEQRPTNNG